MSELDGIPAALLALVLLVWFADWGENDDARLIAGRSRLMAGCGGQTTRRGIRSGGFACLFMARIADVVALRASRALSA